jgi:hypothetical protein
MRNKKEIKVFKQFQFVFENNLKKVFIIAAFLSIRDSERWSLSLNGLQGII